jgi:glutamyl-tRNA reductase
VPEELLDGTGSTRTGPLAGRRILVVGVGRMGRLAAFAAHRRAADVLIANRTPEHAAALAAEVDGDAVPFTLDGSVPDVDGVVVAVAGRWPLESDQIRTLAERGVPVVDLSSPPAVPPQLQLDLGDRFVSVDDLATGDGAPGARLRHRLEKLVSESGREYCQWIRARETVPAIQAMVATAEEHRRAELAWLVRRMPDLAPEDVGLVEQMSHRLVAAILHAPLAALNGDSTGDLERAARELFNV